MHSDWEGRCCQVASAASALRVPPVTRRVRARAGRHSRKFEGHTVLRVISLIHHFDGFHDVYESPRHQTSPNLAGRTLQLWETCREHLKWNEACKSGRWSCFDVFWRFFTNLTSLLGEGKNTQMVFQRQTCVSLGNRARGGCSLYVAWRPRPAWECLLHSWTSYSSHCDKSRDGEVPLWSVSKLEN